jgi:hypothetical protein
LQDKIPELKRELSWIALQKFLAKGAIARGALLIYSLSMGELIQFPDGGKRLKAQLKTETPMMKVEITAKDPVAAMMLVARAKNIFGDAIEKAKEETAAPIDIDLEQGTLRIIQLRGQET